MNNTVRFFSHIMRSCTPAFHAASLNLLALGGLSVLATSAAWAQGGLNLSVSSSVTAPAGTNAFEVVLSNTDAVSYQVAGFSYELTTIPEVTFLAAGANSPGAAGDTYIFNPAFFPDITSSNTGQDLIAGDSDFADKSGYKTVNPGDTYSLGDISYTVAAGATPGDIVPVSFSNVYPSGTQATSKRHTHFLQRR
jgi:hypothetical protein